jgi:TLC domain
LYAIQLSFYLLELLTLLLVKERRSRSDAVVYFFHHMYTVTLLAGSWLTLDHRIGSLVLFLHDVGDIFLPIGKCFTYSEEHTKKTRSPIVFQIVQASGIFFFVMFIITFAVPRIFFFGGLIYYSVYELHWTTCCGVLASGACGLCPAPLYMGLLVGILGLLWPMHIFWFYLIMRMAGKVVFGQYQDVRSDDESEVKDRSAAPSTRKKDDVVPAEVLGVKLE